MSDKPQLGMPCLFISGDGAQAHCSFTQDSKTKRAVPSHCQTCTDYHPLLHEWERQKCEVWTRVMGYHRPVSQFNDGKQAEHAERKLMKEPT